MTSFENYLDKICTMMGTDASQLNKTQVIEFAQLYGEEMFIEGKNTILSINNN